MADKAKDQGDGSRRGTGTVGKRRLSPVRDGLRDRPERKPIILENYYAALDHTENLEKRQRPYYGQDTTTRQERNSHHQRNDRLRSNGRLHRQRGLQQTRDQDDQSKETKGDLPRGRKVKRYGSCYPYDESTYGR